MKGADLDRYDMKILQVLSRDGRISWNDLADEIGLSATPTLRRVRKMEEAGLIKGYAALLDQSWLTGSMPVFITVRLERQTDEVLAGIEGLIGGLPEVVSGYLMSGVNDYLLHAFVRDLDHYRDLLGNLTKAEGIAHIESSFVLKSAKDRAAPAIARR